MDFIRCAGLTAAALGALAALGCGRADRDQMGWARTALERNDQIEIVATDPRSRTFTVRVKDSGELRMVRADQLVAGPGGAALPEPADAAAGGAPDTAASQTPPATAQARNASRASAPGAPAATAAPGVTAGEPASGEPSASPEPAASSPTSSSLVPQKTLAQAAGGRVLEQGPGYSIKAAAASAPAPGGRLRDTGVTSAALEQRHEPIVCQGARMLHIDNRNLEFDGNAVSAEDGCEIHITNSHISATGVGITARAANVHIDNSLIEGDTASIDASDGAQVYASSSRFKGLSRRLDTAAFHDLGGNVWN